MDKAWEKKRAASELMLKEYKTEPSGATCRAYFQRYRQDFYELKAALNSIKLGSFYESTQGNRFFQYPKHVRKQRFIVITSSKCA
jgi:hypothetical protein